MCKINEPALWGEEGMIIAYTELDKKIRREKRQIYDFFSRGAKHVFIERHHGERTEFTKALNLITAGDHLMVETMDQLGRNYQELITVVKTLKEKKASLLVTSIPLLSRPIVDFKVSQFVEELLIQLLKDMKEREKLEHKRRQAEGIQAAKEKGVYKGKPTLYAADAKDPEKRSAYYNIVKMLKDGEPIQKIARQHQIARTTVYRIKQELNQLEKDGDACQFD